MRILARFMLSASDLTQFPAPGVPEIAFLGRSNVGKSSVINSLVGTKLARTSNTPGRTRSINFYEVRRAGQPRPEILFADLPGYGYAKVSREIADDWARFVDPYLHQRSSLALCLALVDSNIPPQQSDQQLLEFLSAKGRPHIVDAIKNGEIQLVFNTTEGAQALADSRSLRRAALLHKVPYYTTLSGAIAAALGIKAYLGSSRRIAFNEMGIFRHYPELDR